MNGLHQKVNEEHFMTFAFGISQMECIDNIKKISKVKNKTRKLIKC